MTIAPISGPTFIDAKSESVRPAAHGPLDSAAFQQALTAQAEQAEAGSDLSRSSIMKLASASEAADNAWVNVMAVLEKLQSPNLGRVQSKALLQELSANYQKFQAQSEPIARLVNGAGGK